jgi:hypothetical protein
MIPEIVDPQILFVKFENQGGDWIIKIPNAYKDGSEFLAPIDENLSLQFQPVMLNSFLGHDPRPGIACIPLHFEDDPEETKGEE